MDIVYIEFKYFDHIEKTQAEKMNLKIAPLIHLKGNGCMKKLFSYIYNPELFTKFRHNILGMSKCNLRKKLEN